MMRKYSLLMIVLMALWVSPVMGSIIKKPPSKPTETLYKDLVCTEQDQSHIHEIISTMAEKGWVGLLFRQGHLRELGAQITHVHPLKFLAVIFKDPHLKSCMPYIWDDGMKRGGFLDGLIPSLMREAEKSQFKIHLEHFALDIGASVEALQSYLGINTWENWENMVFFLIQL